VSIHHFFPSLRVRAIFTPSQGANPLHEKFNRFRPYIFLLLAFLAGCLVSGLFLNRQRFATIGELNQRYYREYGRAAETVRRLEDELERERKLNSRLREHNTRAREIAGELAASAERNVRNLQDAVGIIGECGLEAFVCE
jgi:hypothetical protein